MADAMTSQNPAHLCARNLDRIASSPRQSIQRPQACVGDTAAARGAHNPFPIVFCQVSAGIRRLAGRHGNLHGTFERD